MPPRPAFVSNKEKEEARQLGLYDLSFTERCEWIMRELDLLSREELLEISYLAGQGGAGFGPMRQLQLKIRHNPLTLGPEIMGIFRNPDGKIFERIIQWPMEFEKIATEWRPSKSAYVSRYDWYPYRTIDPLLDEWDRTEEAFGPDHPNTKKVIEKFLRRVLKGYEDDHDKPTGPRNPNKRPPGKRAVFFRRWSPFRS